MSDVIELIDNINKDCDELNSMTENNDVDFDLIIKLVDSLDKLSNKAALIENKNIDLVEYNEKLKLALDAFEEKDFNLFSDIMQYELKPLLEYWKDNIV